MEETSEKSARYVRRFCDRTYPSDLTGRLSPESAGPVENPLAELILGKE